MSAGAFFLLTTTCVFVTNSLENISNNGWRPMSNEKVAELQNFIKYPRNIPSPVHTIRPDIYTSESQRRAMQIQLKETKQYIRENDDVPPFSSYDLHKESQFISNNFSQQAISKEKQKIRKSKKIDEITLPKMNLVNILKNKQDTTKISSNYEVTEDTKEGDKQIEDKETKFGYVYAKPKAEIKRREEKNNLTKNFFSILADYNIRTSDQLPNYAISLRQNSRHSGHDYVYMLPALPVRTPLSYNSLNHVPVDSLLAVFLSNYGQYLPGLYGFQRNYNNLYGYLASNNIHNNKPFGSYKIFSDTDTYH